MDDNKNECQWFSNLYEDEGASYGELLSATDTCNKQGEILSITLNELGLDDYSPYIPSEFGFLTSLSRLELAGNSINASLSAWIPIHTFQQMTSLTSLHISGNSLSGPIPSELGLLSSMEALYFSTNTLSGHIPSELGILSNMEFLFLNSNSLSGTIPSELRLVSSMSYLQLSENTFAGPVPSELGLFSSMSDLALSSNSLTGPIPSEFGLLTNMTVLQLSDNTLTGRIPSELGSLEWCYQLDLSNNELTRVIPLELCYLGQSNYLGNQLFIFGNSNVTGNFVNDTCAEVVTELPEPPVDWPGYFPPLNATHEVGVNIRFDFFLNETEWLFEQGQVGECNWSSQMALDLWDMIDSGVGKEQQHNEHLYFTQALLSETFYRFTLTDSFSDLESWATITTASEAENPTASVLWSLDVDAFEDITVVHMWVDKEGHVFVVAEDDNDSNSTYCLDNGVV